MACKWAGFKDVFVMIHEPHPNDGDPDKCPNCGYKLYEKTNP